MRFRNRAVNDSIAKNINLVFEITDKKGLHRGSIIIKQSTCQYYDTLDNHRNKHFTLLEQFQVPAYIGSLEYKGFKKIRTKDISQTSRPDYWYMVLHSYRDYYAPEVTVLNNIHRNPLLKDLVNAIPFQWIGEEMFVREYKSLMKSKRKPSHDIRGNLRWDEGRTGVCSTDDTVFPGMNVPAKMTKNRSQPGEKEGESRADVIHAVGFVVNEIADTISRFHPHKEWTIARKPFSESDDRAAMFSVKASPTVNAMLAGKGIKTYRECFEALSIIGTGETVDRKVKKTEEHTDKDNAHDDEGKWPTYNRCPTVVRLVDMKYSDPGKHVVVNTGRVCANIYCKSAVSQSMERYEKWNDILDLIKEWQLEARHRKTSSTDDMRRKFKPPKTGSVDGTWTYDADSNKDCFYSLFVNEILEVAKKEGHRDEALMIEALSLMPFTPSPNRFRDGIQNGYKSFVKERSEAEMKKSKAPLSNLLEHCVRYLETLPGGVGGGENSRYRAQGVKLKKRDTIFQSLANLRTAIQLANVLDDTDWIVRRMAKPVPSGGVYGVGRFHAQQIIDVAVKVGLIRKCVHLEKVCISGSTHTAEVLREKFDVDIEKDIMGLSVFLGKKLRKSPSEVENMLCEAIRWRYRRGMATKKDVFVRGHELFVVKDGQVVSFSSKGCSTIHTFAVPSIQKRRKYGEKWWTGGWQRACNDVDLLLKGKRE